MKFKKILAVALAATTAFTLVPANLVQAKSTITVTGNANVSGSYLDKDDTFTVTKGSTSNNNYVTYTFKVTTPIDNRGIENDKAKDNGSYTNGLRDAMATTSGFVTLSAVSVGSNYTGGSLTIPGVVVGHDSATYKDGDSDGTLDAAPGGYAVGDVFVADTESFKTTLDTNKDGIYVVNKVELDGSSTDGDKITSIAFSSLATEGQIKTFKAENFEKLTTVTSTGNPLPAATKIDLSNTKLDLATQIKPLIGTAVTELDLSDLIQDTGINKTATTLDLVGGGDVNLAAIKDLNVKGANISSLKVATSAHNLKLNISDVTDLATLEVNNTTAAATIASAAATIGAVTKRELNWYNTPTLAGVTFITDGSTETRNLDLSGCTKMDKLVINYAGLTGFTAPTIDSNGGTKKIDVSHNALTSVSLSNASDAVDVDISDNMLMDADVSGLVQAQSLDVSNNFLTTLDVSQCEKLKSGCTTSGNYIYKENLTKDSSQTGISLGDQAEPIVAKFSFTGDLGQGLGADTKAMMKLGGSGALNFGVMVIGAPDGFAERLAETVDFVDANDSESSAVQLGSKSIVMATEMGYNGAAYGSGNKSVILASVPVTGNAAKSAANKVTARVGNYNKVINISTDTVALVNYDIQSAIPNENCKNASSDQLILAQFYYPTTAYVLGSNGTVNATIQSEKPVLTGDGTAPINAYTMKGLSFTKWNKAADGSGDAVSSGGRIQGLSEDTTLYAQYTENTYSIKFDKNSLGSGVENVSGSTTTQTKIAYGEGVNLNSSGFSAKSGNWYGWKNGKTYYSDGQSVNGLAGDDKKTGDIQLSGMFGDVNHYTTTEVSSISLVVGDYEKGAYAVDDLDAVVTGAPTLGGNGSANDKISIDLGYDENDTKYDYLSSDTGVVEYNPGNALAAGYLVAKGAGTANVYVRDKEYGNLATVTVTVTSKDQAASDAEQKAKIEKAIKAIEANEKVDVSEFSTVAKTVKKNGEGTVTVYEGQNKKTIDLAKKIVIGDKSYTITKVAANAYKGSSKLTTLSTGNKVTYIGKNAFANCKKLSKLTLGTKVASIKSGAFSGTVKLKTVVVKTKKLTTTKKVAANAFKNAGKKVKTTVNFKSITKKVAKKERTVLKKRGLKTYGKKTTTFKRNGKKF